jgi:hypothetical protein
MATSTETNLLDFSHLIWDEKMQAMDKALKEGGSWYDLVMNDQEERLKEVERQLEANKISKKTGRWRVAAELQKERAELQVALGLKPREILEAFEPYPEELLQEQLAEAAATPQKPKKPTEAPGAPKKPQVSLGMFGAFADSDSE